jgi:hypothetical protein
MTLIAMKYVVSAILGAFSGSLITVMGISVARGLGRYGYLPAAPGPALLGGLFLVGWIVSALLLVRLAEDAVKVIKRGSLLGAGEWLLFSFVAVIFDSQTPFQGRAFGADEIKAMIFGGLMILLCLATYTLARFMSPERSPKTAPDLAPQMNKPILKQCSRCGQLAEPLTRFCNSCGTPFVAGGQNIYRQ